MRIKKMTATFGKLDGAVLELREGLNILTAPNEAGKSTWCAFLRAMLYGIPTRERDTRTALAEKNRYAPWSGAPMAGEIELTWRGQDITLRRFAKGASPFGGFEAVYTGTGEAVSGLTAENCGEVLLGVGRETFQRTAFVGQSGVPIDADPDLEKRIAALVSSGEEDVSYSQTEKTLRGWLNRRRHNKTGLIPRLEEERTGIEGELAQMRQLTRQAGEAESQRDELTARKGALEAEAAAQKARQEWARREQYKAAVAELEAARKELADLEAEAGPLPDKEKLRQAQGELAYLKTLEASQKEAQNQREPARRAVDRAEQAAADPVFDGMDPDQAWKRANEDAARVRELEQKRATPQMAVGVLFLLAAAAFGGAGALSQGNYLFFAAAGLELAAGVGFLLAARKSRREWDRERRAILARSESQFPDDILARANAYRERWVDVEEARRRSEAVEQSIRDLDTQRERLWLGLLAFVHGFAPAVTDPFGVSAALSRALSLDERVATARVKAEGARKLVASIPMPEGPAPAEGTPPPPPAAHSPAETAAALAAVSGELSRLERELAALQGRRTALGDPDALEAGRDALERELERRQGEYRALSLALEVLDEANAQLQARFSPELNRRAGELFAALTGGRYASIALNREFEASVRPAGDVLPRRALSLSRGTVDQLYLAVRLAVCDLALPAADPAPLVLDDALADFDDGRMALALETLEEYARGRQVLLFTCHGREAAWREGRG